MTQTTETDDGRTAKSDTRQGASDESSDGRVGRRSFLGGVAALGTAGLVRPVAGQETEPEQRDWLQARESTVLIEAFGNYNFPEVIAEDSLWGSGAIIDPSGLAVTNAHVVAGADTLAVYVGDDQQRSYNAQILGLSECADIAVIDLEGEEFPALSWRDEPITPGLQIGAHGFPIGGRTMASTQGAVSRVEAAGETEWASVDSVIEHTASIAPGSSGGPLVDANSNLVGINYALSPYFLQYYAVGRQVAQPLIERLRAGEDIHYLGFDSVAVETQAPMTPDGITRGLHVVSVEPGLPAGNAGLEPGDRIVRIRGSRAVSPDTPSPTKAFYCDVLRTHGSDAVHPVLVFRPNPGGQSGGLLLEGEINGQALQVVPTETAQETVPEYAEFQSVADETGLIQATVPAEWSDVDGSRGGLGPKLDAAPDLDAYYNSWTVPGVTIVLTEQFGTDPDVAIDEILLEGCGTGARESITVAGYSGVIQEQTNCNGSGTDSASIAAVSEDESHMLLVQAQLVSDRDRQALAELVDTLQITGDPTTVDGEGEPDEGEPDEGEPNEGEPDEEQPPEDDG